MKWLVVILASLLLARTEMLRAQEAKGSIVGRVTDAKTGQGLPSVNVVVKGTYYGASTDLDGKYQINNVNPGTYILSVSLIGYTAVEHTNVKVAPGQKTEVNIGLEETALTLGQEILVVGDKPLLNIEETASRHTITREDIRVAALENVKEVVSRQVGVVETDKEIHIRGGRSYEGQFLVDGVSVQDPLAGTGFGLQVSSSSVQEVEVLTGGYNAEYGQATSGVINVTTREGGTDYRGSFSYKRDHFWFNRNSAANFNQDIYEASLSGPEPLTNHLLRSLGIRLPGEITFFGNVFVGLRDPYPIIGEKYSGGLLSIYRLNFPQRLNSSIFHGTRFAPRNDNNWNLLGKVTWKFSPQVKLAYSYNLSVSINQNTQTLQTNLEYIEPSPGNQYLFQNLLDHAAVSTHYNEFHSLALTHVLSPKTFYELKLTKYFTHFRSDANGKNWNQYEEPKDIVTLPLEYYNTGRDTIGVIPGDGFYDVGDGGDRLTWHDHYLEKYTVKFDVTHNATEKNKFKAGFEANVQEMQLVEIYQPWVKPLGLNNDMYKVSPASGDFYAQNTVTFKGMILNFGLRFDYWFPGKFVDDAVANPEVVTIPQTVRDNYFKHTYSFFGRRWKGRISPRLGISHPVSDNQTLFFSYGHFSKLPRPQFVYAKLNPVTARSTFQTFGNPDLNPETTVAYEMGLRNQFTNDDVLTITAYYKDIFDYVTTRSVRIVSPRFSGGRFITYVNADYVRSRGVEIEYKKRIGTWLAGSISGTYSVATGKSSIANELIFNLQQGLEENIKENYLIWDRPIQFSANVTFYRQRGKGLFGFGEGVFDDWSLYVRAFYQSGKRYTPQIFVGTAFNGRPEFIDDRSHLYGNLASAWFWIDMNFEKKIRVGGVDLAFVIEGQNILNRKNAQIINPVTGRAYEYGDPTPSSYNDPLYPRLQFPVSPYPFNPARYLPPRSVRMGMSLHF